MKQIIISFIIFSIIYCDLKACINSIGLEGEFDEEQCEKIVIEEDYNEFSCYLTKYYDYFDGNDMVKCAAFPNDNDSKKIFFKYLNGFKKEYDSKLGDITKNPFYYYTELENYNPDVKLNSYNLKDNEKEKEIMSSKNTCSYHLYGRVYLPLESGETLTSYPNIKNKNICFNSVQFPELEDIIDCGYANIKYTFEGKEYNFNTCFYFPGIKMTKNIEKYFKKIEIDRIMLEEISTLFKSFSSSRNLNSKSRKDGNQDNYEIIVENKNGIMLKISSNSNEFEQYERNNYSTLLFFALINSVLLILLILALKYYV